MIEALELIKSLPLEGAVVTGDAAFTYKPVAEVPGALRRSRQASR